MIGSPLVRGISGGQSKRVNIGLAIVTHPKTLFLNETISRLDSSTSNDIVDLLKTLCVEGGRIIVCTIYSFHKFEQLHMLHKVRTIYNSAVSKVQSYFESFGYYRDLNCYLPK